MVYSCRNCGASAEDSSKLCNPSDEPLNHKFCGASPEKICDGKLVDMTFVCTTCGSFSADSTTLCSPSQVG
jgi:hypothetical protein